MCAVMIKTYNVLFVFDEELTFQGTYRVGRYFATTDNNESLTIILLLSYVRRFVSKFIYFNENAN